MDKKEIVKEYHKGDLTVIWKPQTCIHAAVCVSKLPEVYNPKKSHRLILTMLNKMN